MREAIRRRIGALAENWWPRRVAFLKEIGPPAEVSVVCYRSARAVSTREEEGFTFVEIMTVVLIIAVLIAIAVPSFLGAKTRASDRSAQSSLRIAITNVKAIYSDTESFTEVTVGALSAAESSLRFTSGPSTGPNLVSVASAIDGVVLAARSSTGTCYVIADTGPAAGTVFGSLGSSVCDASTVPALPTTPPTALRITAGGGWAQGW